MTMDSIFISTKGATIENSGTHIVTIKGLREDIRTRIKGGELIYSPTGKVSLAETPLFADELVLKSVDTTNMIINEGDILGIMNTGKREFPLSETES